MYNHNIDSKRAEIDKWSDGEKLKKIELEEMPKYLIENFDKYKIWLEL